MFSEEGCLENLKRILSETADDENIKNLSLDELQSSYAKIADNIFFVSVSNQLKFKNMLWNFDQLKPEIRSQFQTQLFAEWHRVYLKPAKADQTEDHPDTQKQRSTQDDKIEKSPDIDKKKPHAADAERQPIEINKQKAVESNEDTDLGREVKPAKKESFVSTHKYENDWFDKLLDFFAAIVGGVAVIMGY